jgi:hypothetical protein
MGNRLDFFSGHGVDLRVYNAMLYPVTVKQLKN